MSKQGIQVPVTFGPRLDEAAVAALEKRITALMDGVDVPINVDDEAVAAIIDEVIDQISALEAMMDGMEMSVDSDEVQKAVDEVVQKIAALDGATINLGADGVDDIMAAAQAYDQLEANLTNQKKALAVMRAEGRENTEEYQRLAVVVEDNAKRFNEMKAAVEGVGTAVDGMSKGTGDSATKFLALSEAGEKLEEIFGGIVERGEEYQNNLKQIKAQTGLVGDALAEFQDQADSAFKRGLGESPAEALKMMGEARRQFGQAFQGQELEDLAVSLGNTAKAFDKEFGEIASRASVFQKAFNLDGAKTAGLVTLALRDAKTASDDVLDSLAEFSPLMAEAGLQAEEFVGMLSRADGTFSTAKISDGIKELGIRLKAGDVQTGINDLVANFGQRIPEALSATLTAVAQEGQAGLKSTADVLRESTAAIEAAFTSGEIDKNIRGGLQAAFAGAPAEELGSDLYARVFSAPIDTKLVAAQAAAAQAAVDNSFKPTALESFAKGFEAIEQRASAAFVPLAKGGQAIADLGPKLNAIKQLIPEEQFKKLSSTMETAFSKGGKAILDNLGPLKDKVGAMGPAMFGPWGIAIAAATGLLALFFTQTDEGKEILSDIQGFFTDLYEEAKPALEAIGSLIGTVGKLVYEIFVAQFELAIDMISGLFDLVSDLFSSGDGNEGEGIKEFFNSIVDGAEKAKLFIEGIIGAFKAMKDSVGTALKALITGDLGGFVDALGNIGTATSEAFQKGVNEAADKLETKHLQEKLTGALTIKGNLDENDALGKLVDKYKNAKDEVTKQNLAAQIAQQVPGAVESVRTVVDETTGKVTEVYDIAIDKASDYVTAQKDVLSKGVEGGADAFFQLLQKQVGELDANKAKLQELATEITKTAASGGDVSKLTKEYEKQKEATEASAAGVQNIVTQGKGLGLTAKDVERMAAASGKTAEETQKLTTGFKLADEQVRKTAVSAKVLGDAFQQALSRVDGSLNTAMNGLAGAQLRIKELTAQIGKEKDPAKLEQLKQQLEDVKKTIPDLNKQLRESAREQVNLQETQARIGKTVESQQRSTLERRQRALAQEQAQIDLTARLVELRRQEALIAAGREEDTIDQLKAAEAALLTSMQNFEAQAKVISKNDAAAKQLLGKLEEIFSATNDLNIGKDVGLRIGLRAAEGDGAFDLKADIGNQFEDVKRKQLDVLTIRTQLKAQLDPSELLDIQKEIEQRQFDIQVELGLKGPTDVLERLQTQIETLRGKAVDFEAQFIAINDRIAQEQLQVNELVAAAAATTDEAERKRLTALAQNAKISQEASRARLEQDALALRTKIAGIQLQILDGEQQSRVAMNETFDQRAARAQEAFDREAEKVVAGYDRELDMVNTFIAKKQELELASIDEAKQAELAAIDEVLAARQAALDEARSVAEQNLGLLEKFGLLGEEGIDTERELMQRRLDMQKEFEEKRKAEEERAQAAREEAERVAADKALALQKIAEGEALAVTQRRELAELELRRKGLEEQAMIAREKARLSGLKADQDAADSVGRELDKLTETIATKGDTLQQLTGTLNGGLSDAFATLFSGNEEAIADSFRGLFGVLGGALKKAGTAFVVDIVLSSPWLKTAIGLNPLLGVGITAGVTGLLTGIVSSLLDPLLSSLTSFASGGRVDTPTLALVGDARRLGGSSDREWILRDEQLWQVVASATAAQTQALMNKLDEVKAAFMGGRILGTLRGNDIYLAWQGIELANQKRQREP